MIVGILIFLVCVIFIVLVLGGMNTWIEEFRMGRTYRMELRAAKREMKGKNKENKKSKENYVDILNSTEEIEANKTEIK